MNMAQKSLFGSFLAALAMTLFFPILLPAWGLAYFAPFLIIVYYQKRLLTCLWASLLCGLILDLLSSKTHLGFHGLAYLAATSILFPRRRNFFGDNLTTMPLMVFFSPL